MGLEKCECSVCGSGAREQGELDERGARDGDVRDERGARDGCAALDRDARDRCGVCDNQAITLAAKVAYNGAPFCGFARQPECLTVQGEIEHALTLLFRREVLTVCAGRTDAGVHAKGQVVSFDIEACELRGRTLDKIERSINALTHDYISVRELCQVQVGFSARFDAKTREYRYFIQAKGLNEAWSSNAAISGEKAEPAVAATLHTTTQTAALYMRDFCWSVPYTLDVAAMRAGAAHLIGEHDFISFCKAQSAIGKPTHRYVSEISLDRVCVFDEELLQIKVVGNAFLHSMVRTIVGTLVAVGRGGRTPDWVCCVLAAKNRSAAGECAPARGLTFWKVNY